MSANVDASVDANMVALTCDTIKGSIITNYI